jgi:enediyne biosynthesis protein E4
MNKVLKSLCIGAVCLASVLGLFVDLSQPAHMDLLVHLGPVVLENVTRIEGISNTSPTFGAAAYDIDLDGWPDLLISNHGRPPLIYLNNKGQGFRESAILHVPGSDRHAPVEADFDNDGDQDLFFQHGAHRGLGVGPKELWLNPGNGKPFILLRNSGVEDPKGRGRGAAWFDYDDDGFVDLFAVNQFRADAPNQLYHNNNGTGTFKNVSDHSGLKNSIDSEGAIVAGDIDNDGDMDIMVASFARPYLYINQADGTFRDETSLRGIPLVPGFWALGMADYNNDGFLDLYISRGTELLFDGALLSPHRINFEQVTQAPNDSLDTLTFNAPPDAVLTFELPNNKPDLQSHIYVGAKGVNPGLEFMVGPQHLSANGKPAQWRDDGGQAGLFIWRDATTNVWTIATAAGRSSFSTNGLVTTDSIVSNLTLSGMEPSTPSITNLLLQNQRNGTFIDVAGPAGVADPSNSRSPIWVDLDNDRDLDLFIVNAGFGGSGKQPNTCYINEEGVFKRYQVPMDPFERLGRGDGGLVADFNGDGKEDLFIVNGFGLFHAGPYQLFLNRTKNENRWVNFKLVGGGKNYTNRDAIGAKIKVQFQDGSGKSIWGFVLGGSGSSCQPDRTLHFGLGSSNTIIAEVHWPPSLKFPHGHLASFHFEGSQLNRNYVVVENHGLLFSH